jgi:hypothetical protein
MAVLKVHLPAHVVINVPEHLGEKLMTRLEGEYTSPAIFRARPDNCQLVDDQARDVKFNRL